MFFYPEIYVFVEESRKGSRKKTTYIREIKIFKAATVRIMVNPHYFLSGYFLIIYFTETKA